jgi:hypothetical protein
MQLPFRFIFLSLAVLSLIFFNSISVLAATFDEVWSTNSFNSSTWTPESLQTYFADSGYDLTRDEAAQIIALEDAGNLEGSRALALESVSPDPVSEETVDSILGGVGGGDETTSYIAPAASTARFIFTELVIPKPLPLIQVKKADLDTAMKKSRSIGGAGRAQILRFDDAENGELYGLNIGLIFDEDDKTYGFMYAFDFMNFDSVQVSRNNFIGFIQKHIPLSDVLESTLTGHVNYAYSYADFENGDYRGINMGGAGLSGALTYDRERYLASLGLSYSYNRDDTNAVNDDQHLIKLGTILGIRQGEHIVYDVSFVYNLDLTDYEDSSGTNDYFELGTSLRYDFTEYWSCTVGYKKVLGISGFDSDEYILGATWRF